MITWPAVIKYEGDEELTYIDSAEEWTRDVESHLYNHTGDDCLIDSNGHVFSLQHVHGEAINAEDNGERITLEQFIRLVRIHASNSHNCCIEKINFRNIAEGIKLVASMDASD